MITSCNHPVLAGVGAGDVIASAEVDLTEGPAMHTVAQRLLAQPSKKEGMGLSWESLKRSQRLQD